MNTHGNEMNSKSWAKLCKDCAFVDKINLVNGDVDLIFIKYKLVPWVAFKTYFFIKCFGRLAMVLKRCASLRNVRVKVIYSRVF